MLRLNGSRLFLILFSHCSLSVIGGEVLAVETAVHVYLGCVNVIPTTQGAKPMALCAGKGPRIVYDNSAIIQAGFAEHMDNLQEDYPRLDQLITWPPSLKDVYIGADLCIYPQPYNIIWNAPNIIFNQCITQYYDRSLGKVSNPYYVWYHKDKNLVAETLDGSDSPLTAGIGDYQEFTTTPLEQQPPTFSISDDDQLLGSGAEEGDLDALTASNSQTDYESGIENGSQDFNFLYSISGDAGVDDDDIFTSQPTSAGSDLDQLFMASSADDEVFSNRLIFFS